jgi:hypothetical protein
MGLFDKFKQMANAVTGGGAAVSVHLGAADDSGAMPVTVTAVVGDAPLSISSVYVILRGLEVMQVDPKKALGRFRSQMQGAEQLFRQGNMLEVKEESFEVQLQLSGAQTLAGGDTYEWTGELRLPAGAPGSFQSKHMRHVIQLKGGIDAPGNDPDSGWVDVRIA